MTLISSLCLLVWAQADGFPRAIDLGVIYPIAERDALEEIEARAAGASVTLDDFGDSDGWTAMQGVRLPLATETASRMVTPIHQMAFAIPDRNGDPIYPEGYTFNPLEHAVLPGRLIVTPPDRIAWARAEAGLADMILLSGGNALKTTVATGERIFTLNDGLAERLGLEAVPAIVEQVGAQLKVVELEARSVPLDRPDPSGREAANVADLPDAVAPDFADDPSEDGAIR